MKTTPDGLIPTIKGLVAEEAHLIGQELQDALNKKQLLRLQQLSAELNEADALLTRRRPTVGPGSS